MDFEKEMAMFRYAVITPLLHGNDERSLKKRVREQAAKIWTLPNGRLRQFSWGAIEDWVYAYRRDGMAGLTTGQRKDRGDFREIGDNVRSYIDKHIREYPRLKISVMINLMKEAGVVVNNHPSNSTIYRYVKTIRPQKGVPLKERRSFEAPYAGNLWQTPPTPICLADIGNHKCWNKRTDFMNLLLNCN